MESNHDAYRRRKAIADSGGNYRKNANGKGDIDRSTHLETYRLGSELIDISEKIGQDSDEYRAKLKEWRAAVRAASTK